MTRSNQRHHSRCGRIEGEGQGAAEAVSHPFRPSCRKGQSLSESERTGKRQRGRIKVPASLALALVLVVPVEAAGHPYHDEYVNKLDQGVTERVSVSSSGKEADGHSGSECGWGYSASDNGRFVAFVSLAGNLHPGDVNGKTMPDVFVYDRGNRTLHLASALATGLAPEVPGTVGPSLCSVGSFDPAISGNGRYVAFRSSLPLTGTGDAEAAATYNVYVRDLKRHKTELVSRTWNDGPAAGMGTGSGRFGLSISDDGRLVAFESDVRNITQEDPCLSSGVPSAAPLNCRQVYVRDREMEETIMVSRSIGSGPSNSFHPYPQISGDGRHVVFNSGSDVLIHDLRTTETELVSVSRNGGSANDMSTHRGLSDDGRFVLFSSYATDHVPANLADGGTSVGGLRCWGTYVRDRRRGRTERISVTSTGSIVSSLGSSDRSESLSDDGRYLAFHASDGGRFCNSSDSHAYRGGVMVDRDTGQVDWRTFVNHEQEAADGAPPGTGFGVGGNGTMTIGGNARFVFGPSEFTNMVEKDRNDAVDVFVRDIGHHPLGTGPLGGSPSKDQEPADERICVAPDVCVPPHGSLFWSTEDDAAGDPTRRGAKLYGASLAYRPQLGDLYAAIELEHMGSGLVQGPAGLMFGGDPSLLYGLRFEAGGKSYEVRATSLLGGTFGLFVCMDTTLGCKRVTSLKGGYGTTGERVVFSLPLQDIGLEDGGELKDVEAFSGLGSYLMGAIEVLDSVKLK